MADELATLEATALAASLVAGRSSAVAAVDQAVRWIERLDGEINAVVVHDFERACTDAAAADKAPARGDRLPLLGVPVTLKVSFDPGTTRWWQRVYAARARPFLRHLRAQQQLRPGSGSRTPPRWAHRSGRHVVAGTDGAQRAGLGPCTGHAGRPDEDATEYGLALPPCRHGRLHDFHCLVPSDHPFVQTAPEVRDAVETLADRLAAAGARVQRQIR